MIGWFIPYYIQYQVNFTTSKSPKSEKFILIFYPYTVTTLLTVPKSLFMVKKQKHAAYY